MYLSLTPAGGNELVLVTEPMIDAWVLTGQDWGNAAWDHQFAGIRGTQGARPAQGSLPNRSVRLQLRLYGVNTDDMAARVAEVDMVMDHMRRHGGLITRRAHGQTYRQHMQVLTTGGYQAGEWTHLSDLRYMQSPVLEFTCAPYALGDPMGWVDDAAGALASTERVSGSGAAPAVASGLLGIAATGAHHLIDTQRGYRYGDVEAAVQVVPGSTSAGDRRWGAFLRYIDASNWLAVTLEQVSGTGYARIRSCVAGSETVIATATLSSSLTTHAATGGWLVGRVDGHQVQVQFLAGDHPPASPWATSEGATANLTSTARVTWAPHGTHPHGLVGLYAIPQDAAGVGGWRTWRVTPMVMTGNGSTPTHRQARPLRCPIPGTAPALAEVAITRAPASTGGAPVFGLLGWAARRSGFNRCGNGDFGEAAGAGSTAGWSVATASGITGTATSVTAATVGGHASVMFTTTSGSGVHYTLADEFVAGRTYRFTCEARIASGAPVVSAWMGKNGDLANSSGVTLTSAWQTLSVDWTPAADAYGGSAWPTIAVRSNGTAGGTMDIRRVQVYELSEPPVIASQQDGRHGRPPLGLVPMGGGGWTVASSSGGTLGTIDTGVSSILPAQAGVAISGAGNLVASCLIDPALTTPDDYSGGSIDVDVWLRIAASATVTGLRAAVYAQHPAATIGTDEFGGRRAVAPWGTAGRPIAPTTNWRLTRIGPVALDVDPDRPTVWRLVVVLSWAAGSTGGVNLNGIILAPARGRALTHTGVSLSAGGYPRLIAYGGSDRTVTKRIRSDLSATVEVPPALIGGAVGDHGLGGSLLEIPTGDADLLLVTADQVPDDPSPAAAHVGHASHLALSVTPTPRWGHLRDI